MVDRAEVLMSLVRALSTDRSLDPTPDRLCRAAVRVLDAEGGALSLGRSDDRVVVGATSPTARRLEELQDLLGEGPTVEALDRRRPAQTSTSGTFPAHLVFETAAHGLLGDARIVAFPVPVDGMAAVGGLTVWSDPPAWEAERMGLGAEVAGLMGVMLLQGEAFDEVLHGSPWQERVLVHQATGVVMAVLHIPATEALSLLRAHAFASGVGTVAVARSVVEDGDTSWLRGTGEDGM